MLTSHDHYSSTSGYPTPNGGRGEGLLKTVDMSSGPSGGGGQLADMYGGGGVAAPPPGSSTGAPESSSNGSAANTALDSSPAAPNFSGDDDFENLGIHLPQSALDDNGEQAGYPGGYPGQGGGGGGHPHHQYHQQMYQQHMHQQIQQQQQWQQHQQHQAYSSAAAYHHQYDQYGGAGGGGYGSSGYGSASGMYGSGGSGASHSHIGSGGHSSVGMGGPSPVGSHNTPSPQTPSDDGFLSGSGAGGGGSGGGPDDHARNNNHVLKRPGEVSAAPSGQGQPPSQGMGLGPTGGGMSHHVGHHSSGGHIHSQYPHHPHHPHHHHPYGHHLHPHQIPQGIPITKKPKVSKRKKKRDPNEPSKPVSAYALFFRDSQASIKVAHPNAAFGDVSKIVASLWDALDPDSKAAYKKRTENAKKEYLKKLASYRASLVSKGGDSGIGYGYYSYGEVLKNNGIHPASSSNFLGSSTNSSTTPNSSSTTVPSSSSSSAPSSGNGSGAPTYNSLGQPIPPRPPMQQGHPHMGGGGAYLLHGQQGLHNGGGFMGHGQGGLDHGPHKPLGSVPTNHHSPGGSSVGPTPPSNSSAATGPPHSPKPPATAASGKTVCSRPGCGNPVNRSSSGHEGWSSEYCSNECVVGQCKDVYSNWSSSGPGGTNRPSPAHPNGSQQHPTYQPSGNTAVVK